MNDDTKKLVEMRQWCKDNRKEVDRLQRGDVVVALRDMDPRGACVSKGDVGVVFEESNAYNDEGGPMVRFTGMASNGDVIPGGCLNVYDGDVAKMERKR